MVSFRWARTMANHVTTALVLVVALTLLPKALKSQGLEKLPLKEAALWIKEKGGKTCPTIMSNEPLVAYYAGGKHLLIPGVTYEKFVEYTKANRVDFLVFEERDIRSGEQFLSQLQPERFQKVPLREEGVLVYEVLG